MAKNKPSFYVSLWEHVVKMVSHNSYMDAVLEHVACNIKYSGQVEADISESLLGGGETDHEPACHENNN